MKNNISLSGFSPFPHYIYNVRGNPCLTIIKRERGRKINLLTAYKLLIFLAVPSLAVEGLGQKRKKMLFFTTPI
ncbi:MAG: hypothetical protein A3I75_06780 [Deltaproteobacteria bacterium RIFCSPLOWO2_02_FULL_50_16]|nr:MAG: hypothetical protein A2053_05750 [Deltaproteobacteria bacterium GWA2_50_8]OGQ29509.1 MAG: hypothetical protein A3B79_00805 [Deltaproteobacteria bacterium RIFCSPHIGHO2_02_FULL_50_15]OGQ57316.1 MAG: hypothetical protein A3I75_06780 [Deltaproteobacteria bacterium RIFCSPLOWO2_02_FULL_50_16]OGQ66604.1 MAG: hypothetical protein A3F89_05875 [Deltaproteobacteria bacterium RIFCSPLOWO2_12_FULL_50_11]